MKKILPALLLLCAMLLSACSTDAGCYFEPDIHRYYCGVNSTLPIPQPPTTKVDIIKGPEIFSIRVRLDIQHFDSGPAYWRILIGQFDN